MFGFLRKRKTNSILNTNCECIDDLRELLVNLYNNNYRNLYMVNENNLLGFKFDISNKYYLLFIANYKEKLHITFRKDVNSNDKERIDISNNSVKEIIEKVDNILNEIVLFKPDEILMKNIKLMSLIDNEEDDKEKTKKNKVYKEKDNNQKYNRIIDNNEVIDLDNKILLKGEKYLNEKYSHVDIDSLKLSYRTSHQLKLAKIETLADIMNTSTDRIYKIRNLGKKCLKEIIDLKKSVLELNNVKLDKNYYIKNDRLQININKETINIMFKNIKTNQLIISCDLMNYCNNNHIETLYSLLLLKSLENKKLNDELNIIKNDFITEKNSVFVSRYINALIEGDILKIGKINIDSYYEITEERYDQYIDFSIRIGEIVTDLLLEFNQPRAAEIFKYRMNLIDSDYKTLEQLGNKYGVSRERIRQILSKITRRTRNQYIKKLYISQIYSLIKDINEDEVMYYYIFGILKIYNKNFLKFILSTIDEKYCSLVFNKVDELIHILAKVERINTTINSKIDRILNLIKYPEQVKENKKLFDNLKSMREINIGKNTGKVYFKRFNREYEFESFQERKILETLSQCSEIEDIKVQSLLINFNYKDKQYKYYPDFQLLFKNGTMAIIEIKPLYNMVDYNVIRKYSALSKYCEQNGIGYLMIDERYRDFETAINREVDNKLKESFLDYLINHNPMKYNDLLNFKKNNKMDTNDFVNIILNDGNIRFCRSPFIIKYIKNK